MVGFNDWLSEDSPSDEMLEEMVAQIAVDQWNHIQRHRKSIALKRGTNTLDAQTVSVQPGNEERQVELASGKSMTIRDIVIFGVYGHPTVANTDIRKDDQFAYLGRLYKVTDVIVSEGSLQAWAEAIA
jgi:hypothetical protein